MPDAVRLAGPASTWVEALPIGNGRIGAMVFGDVDGVYQIADDRCWSGSPASGQGVWTIDHDEGPTVLRRIREQLAEGDVAKAEREAQLLQFGYSQAFQPLGDLMVPRGSSSSTTRTLDVSEAIAVTRWDAPDGPAIEESFVSHPDGVLVIRRAGARLSRFELRSPHPIIARGETEEEAWIVVRMPRRVLPLHGRIGAPIVYDPREGASLTAVLFARRVTPEGDEYAGELVASTEVDYDGPFAQPHGDVERLLAGARARAAAAVERGWSELRRRHVDDVSTLMGRASLTLLGDDRSEMTTAHRLRDLAEGADDPGLAALAWQYGRYLLVACSRPGTLPANLQGVWNREVRPPWSSNFTTNINLEMNYWAAESANLSECHTPLLDWIEQLSVSGASTAQRLYGARGWTVHHNSDAWAFTLPAGRGHDEATWALWPLGAAWLCRHIWDRWDFGGDREELGRRWPTMQAAARFALDWLVWKDGVPGTSPSTSPENHYIDGSGEKRGLSTSTTADLALIRDLFETCLRVVTELRLDDDGTVAEIRATLPLLPRARVGADGRLAEWSVDVADADPLHRHQSHLYGFYPADLLDAAENPDLALAALATLDARGPHATGWSLVWRMALRARLGDAAGAAAELRRFLNPVEPTQGAEPSTTAPSGVYPNLFCAHPPFQIDGNLGIVAAVNEMLLQSHRGVLRLLPALDPAWRRGGTVRGLVARGGVRVDLEWADGGLARATLLSSTRQRATVEYSGRRDVVELLPGVPLHIDGQLGRRS